VWESARFTSIFLALGFFFISNIVHARPHAGNANRWAAKNMKPIRLSIIVSLIIMSAVLPLSSCQYSTNKQDNLPDYSESNPPIIKVDSNHNFLGEYIEDSPVVLQYEIKAGDGFILDVANYDIQIPKRSARFNITHPNYIDITRPNYIEVDIRKYDHTGIAQYYVDWKSNETLYVFTPQTLSELDSEKSMPGYLRRFTGPQFTGIQSGQEVVVAIVFIDGDGAIYPLWGALINVK
jgi:hypothetical protein